MIKSGGGGQLALAFPPPNSVGICTLCPPPVNYAHGNGMHMGDACAYEPAFRGSGSRLSDMAERIKMLDDVVNLCIFQTFSSSRPNQINAVLMLLPENESTALTLILCDSSRDHHF